MSLTSDPLFETVLQAVRDVITAVEAGLADGQYSVTVNGPLEGEVTIPAGRWKRELQSALEFFEEFEYYEDCASTINLIERIEAKPAIAHLVQSLKNVPKNDSPLHGSD
jgi:hypothetical protein